MVFDIAALQALYGANTSFASGDDSYTLIGENGAGTFYESLWDTDGMDGIAYGGALDAVIHLTAATLDTSPTGAGLMSYVDGIFGGMTIANGVVIENAQSGSGDDLLTGNAADNHLIGNVGDDMLLGLEGSDLLEGGEGDDLLIGDYVAFAPSPVTIDLTTSAATLPAGLTLGDGRVVSGQSTSNSSRATATDISDEFLYVTDPDVLNGINVPNVRIEGVGNNQYDYYEITVTADNVYLALDIDATSSDYDSRIRLLDSNGTQLKDSDDATPTEEGTGLHGEYRQLFDPYSTHGGHLLHSSRRLDPRRGWDDRHFRWT